MKVLFFGDIHVDAMTAGLARHRESMNYVDVLEREVRARGIDVVCFLGDAFDPGSMSEGVYSAFMIEAHDRLTRASKHGSVFIVGNHDVIDGSVPMSTLSPLATAARLHASTWRTLSSARSCVVAEEPTFTEIFDPENGAVGFLALPYVSRGVVRSGHYEETFVRATTSARRWKESGGRIIVLGHFSLPGITPGSEEEMMRGREMPFPTDAIRELAPELVVNGHYHARQTVEVGGVRVEVVGAPTRFTFGEASDGERGFLVAEV